MEGTVAKQACTEKKARTSRMTKQVEISKKHLKIERHKRKQGMPGQDSYSHRMPKSVFSELLLRQACVNRLDIQLFLFAIAFF